MLLDDNTKKLSDTLSKLTILANANFFCRKNCLNQLEVVDRFIKCNKRLAASAKNEMELIDAARIEKINRINELFQMKKNTEREINELKHSIDAKEKRAEELGHKINEIENEIEEVQNKPRFSGDDSFLGYLVDGLKLLAKVHASDDMGILYMLEESKRDLLRELNPLKTELNKCETEIHDKNRNVEEKFKQIMVLDEQKNHEQEKLKIFNYFLISVDEIIVSMETHKIEIEQLQFYNNHEDFQDKIQKLSESIENKINEMMQRCQLDKLIELPLKDLSCKTMEEIFNSAPFNFYDSVPF